MTLAGRVLSLVSREGKSRTPTKDAFLPCSLNAMLPTPTRCGLTSSPEQQKQDLLSAIHFYFFSNSAFFIFELPDDKLTLSK